MSDISLQIKSDLQQQQQRYTPSRMNSTRANYNARGFPDDDVSDILAY